MEKKISGNPVTSGIEIGYAFLFQSKENQIFKESISRNNVDSEEVRFLNGVKESQSQLKKISKSLEKKLGKESALIIETQYLLLKDKELLDSIIAIIRNKFVKSEWAIKQIEKKYIELFSNIPDLAFQEKRNDISDILNRIINNLKSNKIKLNTDNNNIILIADDIPPSIAATLITKKKILGLILEKGCETSHSVILAKTLEIPTIIGTQNIVNLVENGKQIIIDSIKGDVILSPKKKTIEIYLKKKKDYQIYKTEKKKVLLLPDKTKDLIDFKLSANIEFPFESETVNSHGAKGIGLFRTEFLFTESDIAISEEKQYLLYKNIAQKVYPDKLTIRTFDVGRDKTNDFIIQEKEQNPALGTMAVRLFLKEPKLLITQIRAILRANEIGNIKLLFPMITEYEEIIELKKIINSEKIKLQSEGLLSNKILEIGIMIEIPGTIKLIRHLKDEVDFFSLGSNDLIQYLLAVDRNNSSISYLYKPFNPSVIDALKEIFEEVTKIGKEVTVCGEIAGNGPTALLLLGMGFTSFSMNPLSIVEIKRLFTSINISYLENVIKKLYKLTLKEDIKNTFINSILNEYPKLF